MMALNEGINNKEKYIIVKNGNCTVSIRCAKIIKFHKDGSVDVEILGLVRPRETIFHIGEIYHMGAWDFRDNYKYINKAELLAKVL